MINKLFTYNKGRGNRHNFSNVRNEANALSRIPDRSKSPTAAHSLMNQDLSFDQNANRSQPLEFGLANRRVLPITSMGIRGQNVPQK